MAKLSSLEQVRVMLDEADGVPFGSLSMHLDEIVHVCDKALSERAGLIDALEPFAAFSSPEIWKNTAWHGQPDSAAVLYCHATGTEITLGDIKNAALALSKAGAGQ